jgi:hypothetical protein
MGRDALREDWPPLLEAVYALSVPDGEGPDQEEPAGTRRVPAA